VLAMTDYWSATDWDLVEYKAVTRFLTEGPPVLRTLR
jgi:hypothetical protein